MIQFGEVLRQTDTQQNSFTHLKAIPVMNHHHRSLLRNNLRELLTQKFQTLLSKRKQRSWDHDTQSAAVTQLWAGCYSRAGLSGSQPGQLLTLQVRLYSSVHGAVCEYIKACCTLFFIKVTPPPHRQKNKKIFHHCWEVNRVEQIVNIKAINISGMSVVRAS